MPQVGSAAVLEWTDQPFVGFRRFLFRDFVEFQKISTTIGRMAGGPPHLEVERSAEWPRVYAECASAAIQELLASEGVSIPEIKSVLTTKQTKTDAWATIGSTVVAAVPAVAMVIWLIVQHLWK